MEGTLSLFDWRPAHAPSAAAPSAVPARDGHQVDQGDGVPEAAFAVGSEPSQVSSGTPATTGRRTKRAAAPAAPIAAAATHGAPSPSREPVSSEPVSCEPASCAPAPILAAPRIIVFDCETTGTDRVRDQVIELCIQHGLEDDAPSRVWRIKPSVPIHPGAQAVHGITMSELEDCPAFGELAAELTAVFAEAEIIVGYNITFDIDMIQAEYARIGLPLIDFSTKKIVDAFRLWQQCEPRSLMHAHQRFVGAEFAAAHTASADVAATGRVLAGMLRAFDLEGQDWDQIAVKCDPQSAARASWVGPSRHLRWEGEVIVLGFGKHGGAPVHELAQGPDRSFLRWVCDRDFPVHVAEVCKAALELPSAEFLSWAKDRYGQPAPTAAPPFIK